MENMVYIAELYIDSAILDFVGNLRKYVLSTFQVMKMSLITSLRMLHCYFRCPHAGFHVASLLHTKQKSTISNHNLASV